MTALADASSKVRKICSGGCNVVREKLCIRAMASANMRTCVIAHFWHAQIIKCQAQVTRSWKLQGDTNLIKHYWFAVFPAEDAVRFQDSNEGLKDYGTCTAARQHNTESQLL